MGRPSKYDPAYCDMVVEHMENGSSLVSFAASISVARSTINEWMAAHEEFADACARAKAKSGAWWEKRGREFVIEGGTSSAQANFIQFGIKNMAREDWQEKQLVGSDPENPLPQGFTVNLVKATGDA
jgi:hypothetical protein